MPLDLQDRVHPEQLAVAQPCAADGMPLYATIVGPRCPLCGAATPR